MSLLLVALLLFLLFGGSRVAAAGKGLGHGLRTFKRALGGPAVSPPPEAPLSEERKPKLLPARGESSAPKDDPSD